jgi:hypothetical protein
MERLISISIACLLLAGCVTASEGLEPVNPSYGPYSWSTNVHSLTPRLEWVPYQDVAGKENIRYQLLINEGNVVQVRKDSIPDAYYLVEQPLKPNTEYQWRVRPIWTANGKAEGGQWNHKSYFYLSPVLFGWGSKTYKFTTPEK